MAFPAALFRKLRENKSLEEKLSIAKKYYSSRLPVPNRREPVISWLLHYLEDNKSDLTNRENLMLWTALEEALKFQEPESGGDAIILKSSFAKMIIEEIKNCSSDTLDTSAAILSCTKHILHSSSMNSIFVAEYETLMSLFSALLNSIIVTMISSHSQILVTKNAAFVIDGILGYLENQSFYKVGMKKILCSLTSLLEPLAVFFHLSDGCKDASIQKINDKLQSYLVELIFGQTKCYQKLLEVHPDKQEELDDDCSSIVEFFKMLQASLLQETKFAGTVNVDYAATTLIQKLMQGFLLHKRNDHLKGLQVLAILCAVIGGDVPSVASVNFSCKFGLQTLAGKDGLKIIALEKILHTCANHHQRFTNYTEGTKIIKPLEWLRKLSVFILNIDYEANQSAWLGCLHSLLIISAIIYDCNLPHLIKKICAEVSFLSPDAEQTHSKFFCSLLNVYCNLQQLPKFLEQFFCSLSEAAEADSGGEFLIKANILKSVEVTLAYCVSVLPSGQAVELWKLLNSIERKLASLWSVSHHKASPYLSGAILLTARFHSIFLLHARLFDGFTPPAVLAKVDETVKETGQVILELSTLPDLQEREAFQEKGYNICCSVLMLSYALGEMKLAFSMFTNKKIELPDMEHFGSVSEVLILHPYLENKFMENIFSNLKTDTDLLSLLTVRLIVQKGKALTMKSPLSDPERKLLKSVTTFLFKHAISSWKDVEFNVTHIAHQDSAQNTTDLWRLILKHMPLFVNFVSQKELMFVCCTMINILVHNKQFSIETLHEENVASVILNFISHEFFTESKNLQSAFVTAVWKHGTSIIRVKKRSHSDDTSRGVLCILELLCSRHAEWAKHASSTPKNAAKDGSPLNAMWLMVENVASLIHEWLEFHSESKDRLKVSDAIHFMKIMNYLPLEYLLPGNQIRCSLGLSVLMLLLPNCLHKSNAEEIQELAIAIFKAQIAIFEGVRSIWLFDFINIVPFLNFSIKTISVLPHIVEAEGSDGVWYWAQKFLEKLFVLSIRNSKSLAALESYVYELTENMVEDKIKFLATCLVFQRLVSLLQRAYLEEKFRESCVKLAVHIGSAAMKCLKRKKKPSPSMHTLLAKCYIGLFEVASGDTSGLEEEKEHKLVKKLPSIIDIALDAIQLSNLNQRAGLEEKFKANCLTLAMNIGSAAIMSLEQKEKLNTSVHNLVIKCYSDFLQLVSGETCDLELGAEQPPLEKLPSILDIALDSIQFPDFQEDYLQQKFRDRWMGLSVHTDVASLDAVAKISGDSTKLTSNDQLEVEINKETKWLKKLPSIIDIALDAIQSFNDKDTAVVNNQKMLSRLAQKCLVRLNHAVTVTEDFPKYVSLTALNFQCMALILKKLKNYLPKQVVAQCLHPCVALDVQRFISNPRLFSCAFNGVWNILNELLVHHLYIVLASRSSYLACIIKLLKASIKAGNQDLFTTYNPAEQHMIIECAQNIDRMLTSLSKHNKEFGKMIPYLVADYIECVQSMTLHPSVKAHIISAIHRGLDMCSEDSIRMLSVSISYEGREIYSSLIRTYKQIKYTSKS